MAGRPRTKAMVEALERHTRNDLEPEIADSATYLDWICSRVESGDTMKAVALELSTETGVEITYSMLSQHLRNAYGESEVGNRLTESRTRAAHYFAEAALEIVDEPATDKIDVARAGNRARQRNWMAERWGRKDYGQDKSANVTLNIGSLHLDALKAPKPQALAIADARVSLGAIVAEGRDGGAGS